jgi:uncharacterized membrane protein
MLLGRILVAMMGPKGFVGGSWDGDWFEVLRMMVLVVVVVVVVVLMLVLMFVMRTEEIKDSPWKLIYIRTT